MPTSPSLTPSQQDALAMHRRLLANDPTAADDLATAYLQPLVVWLEETNHSAPQETCQSAAEDALIVLIRKPQSYDPELQTLEVYLRMSARGDLRNLLRKEWRHHQGRVDWSSVELWPDAGKYLGRADDPALPLCLAEEYQETVKTIQDAGRELSETDQRALELILRKERRTTVYAELYGLLHLTAQEQRREVKRHKDRLKNVLKRAGRKP